MVASGIAARIRERVARVVGHPMDRVQLAQGMLARADAARDRGDFHGAAALYAEGLRLAPDNAGVQVQCGHMFKEIGDLEQAEAHYRAALDLMPDDPDLALQLGHFYKVAGRLRDSAAAYTRAVALMPESEVPSAELLRLHQAGWRPARDQAPGAQLDLVGPRTHDPFPSFDLEAARLSPGAPLDLLSPELTPKPLDELLHPHHEGVVLRGFGREEPSRWGHLPTFRGVQALRGFYNSSDRLTTLTICVNGVPMHVEPLRPPYELDYNEPGNLTRKYVFNAWADFSPFVRGRSSLQLRFSSGGNGHVRTVEKDIVIKEPLAEAAFTSSDAVITLPEADPRSIEDQINARPSLTRAAKRTFFDRPLHNVLILRTDQLGDMVASIPAMVRLRELLPDARFVGLMTSSNLEFATSLGMFDEIIPLDFPDDRFQRRRIMSLEQQEALRRQLEPYRFDIAIDLAEARVSRPLLRLSGAPYLCGFHDEAFPWLTVGFAAATHDPGNGREMAPHSSAVLAFVERIGALLDTRTKVVRRPELTRDQLTAYGIFQNEPYAVLHTGARIAFNRWPAYYDLARLILNRSALKVVILTEEPAMRAQMPVDLAGHDRFQLIDTRLPFDDFDALLSFCTVFAGNDSGPKHLAALRGAKVVSIHSARVNWNDWGQELGGSIISRKVPCAGCQIYYEADECGKDAVCITKITAEEVFEEIARFI